MRTLYLTAFTPLIFTAFTGTALAKLPPPSPEEQAKAAAAKEKAAENAEKEKALLEKAQDRVVQKYRADHPMAAKQSRGSSTDERTEVPAAALNTRPLEKAGAYNESVTPQNAPGATQGTSGQSAGAPQRSSGTTGK